MQTSEPVSGISRWSTSVVFSLYLLLLFGVALFADGLAQLGWLGLTLGQWLVLVIHTGPVVVAWYYIRAGTGLSDQESPAEEDAP